MRVVKDALKKAIATTGYEIRRSIESTSPTESTNSTDSKSPTESTSPTSPTSPTSMPVRFENFANLATAYEKCINDVDDQILPNDIRPKLLARLLGTPPTEAYFIGQALSKGKDVPGDVCEFGVAQGETSALIANEIASSVNKNFHMFDSFEGLPKPSDQAHLQGEIFLWGSLAAYKGTLI